MWIQFRGSRFRFHVETWKTKREESLVYTGVTTFHVTLPFLDRYSIRVCKHVFHESRLYIILNRVELDYSTSCSRAERIVPIVS